MNKVESNVEAIYRFIRRQKAHKKLKCNAKLALEFVISIRKDT